MSDRSPAGQTTYRPSTTATKEDYVTNTLTPGARFAEYTTAGPAARRILDEIAAEEDRSVALAIGPNGRPVQYDALSTILQEQTAELHALEDEASRLQADAAEPPKKMVDALLHAATALSLTVEQATTVAGHFMRAAEIHPTLYRNAWLGLDSQIVLARTALEGRGMQIEVGGNYLLPANSPVVVGATAATIRIDAQTEVGVDYGPDVVGACEVTFLNGPYEGIGDFWVRAEHLIEVEG